MIPAANAAWREPRARFVPRTMHPAIRLGATLLLVATAMLASWPWLVLLAAALAVGLHRAGLRWARLPAIAGPWLWLAALVLAIHAVTAVDAAPLGRPTTTGLLRGIVVLTRLAVVLGIVALAGRALPLDDLTRAWAWWLRPLRRFGVDPQGLSLAVIVALGTAPRVQAEGRRLLACQRLRRPPGRQGARSWLRMRIGVVPPLVESLLRRAEAVPLVVAWRLPDVPPSVAPPAWPQLAVLAVWLVALVWST
ncbi:hypothetical protein GF314_03280 [bacterium]|nr:hypothetical protein [bacterium]